MKKITLVNGDDCQALYVDGERITMEINDTCYERLVDILISMGVVALLTVDEDGAESMEDIFPKQLADVKLLND